LCFQIIIVGVVVESEADVFSFGVHFGFDRIYDHKDRVAGPIYPRKDIQNDGKIERPSF
tara:strand:- start:108 stop:284 length:177 start_codon:yes stop_codon:yes gene_type:complete